MLALTLCPENDANTVLEKYEYVFGLPIHSTGSFDGKAILPFRPGNHQNSDKQRIITENTPPDPVILQRVRRTFTV